MKRVRDIDFFENIKEIREFEFGVFYYFDGLVISEMKEGVVFGWKMAEKAIGAAREIFGDKMPIAYISNRINRYYVIPSDWIKFYRNREQLQFYAVVGETTGSFVSVILERLFFRNSIRKFINLEEAVQWSLNKINDTNEVLAS